MLRRTTFLALGLIALTLVVVTGCRQAKDKPPAMSVRKADLLSPTPGRLSARSMHPPP